jgi:hypothetical protein
MNFKIQTDGHELELVFHIRIKWLRWRRHDLLNIFGIYVSYVCVCDAIEFIIWYFETIDKINKMSMFTFRYDFWKFPFSAINFLFPRHSKKCCNFFFCDNRKLFFSFLQKVSSSLIIHANTHLSTSLTVLFDKCLVMPTFAL